MSKNFPAPVRSAPKYTYNQGLQDYDCFGIPKGAPNKELALKVIAEMSKPEYQANIPQYITYGPTNSKAYDLEIIGADLAKNLPSHPDNAAKLLPINQEWYAKWEKIGSEMYQDMMTE